VQRTWILKSKRGNLHFSESGLFDPKWMIHIKIALALERVGIKFASCGREQILFANLVSCLSAENPLVNILAAVREICGGLNRKI